MPYVLMFVALTGVYEPSAIQQLADGRFLVVEDEKAHPFSLVTLRLDGDASSTPLLTESEDGSELPKLDDLEGIAADRAGYVYAITSHSRDGKGEEKKSRERLVRFRVAGDRVADARMVTGLKGALTEAFPVLVAAAEVREVKSVGGLNIEGLEVTPDDGRLLLGFRSPLQRGHALVAAIENPREMFESGAAPRLAPRLETLDLGGHGIRGLSWVAALGGYLLVSGPVAKEQTQFRLWFWSGRSGDAPRPVKVPGLQGFEHAEGVCPATIEGQPRIVIVSDDGDREAGRPARFLLLAPSQLQIAP